jgi:hypothetical protein
MAVIFKGMGIGTVPKRRGASGCSGRRQEALEDEACLQIG